MRRVRKSKGKEGREFRTINSRGSRNRGFPNQAFGRVAKAL
jgi:hypothetical protein